MIELTFILSIQTDSHHPSIYIPHFRTTQLLSVKFAPIYFSELGQQKPYSMNTLGNFHLYPGKIAL